MKKTEAGSKNEGKHERRAHCGTARGERSCHHGLGHAAGDEDRERPKEKRCGYVCPFGGTADIARDEFWRLNGEVTKDRMHVEHTQCIADHENADGDQEHGAGHRAECEIRTKPAEECAQAKCMPLILR